MAERQAYSPCGCTWKTAQFVPSSPQEMECGLCHREAAKDTLTTVITKSTIHAGRTSCTCIGRWGAAPSPSGLRILAGTDHEPVGAGSRAFRTIAPRPNARLLGRSACRVRRSSRRDLLLPARIIRTALSRDSRGRAPAGSHSRHACSRRRPTLVSIYSARGS
jgi:hypothetical protein